MTREALATGFSVPATERGGDTDSLFGSEGRGSVRGSVRGSGAPGLLPLMQGRPDTDALMMQLGREAGRVDRAGRGIAVVCCGPRPMVKEVGRQVPWWTRARVWTRAASSGGRARERERAPAARQRALQKGDRS